MVGNAVRVSERKNEPLKELFGDKGGGGGGRKETYEDGRVNGDTTCACREDLRGHVGREEVII